MTKQNRSLDAFLQSAPPPQKSRARAAKTRDSLLAYARELQLPERMARHAVQTRRSRGGIAQMADAYSRGCHLTGKPLEDRVLRHDKPPSPMGAVVRGDGTMVCYAVWLLTQEGAIPDAVLVNVAKTITAHHTPSAVSRPTPPRTPTHQPPQEIHHGAASLFSLGPEQQNDWDSGEPAGQLEPAEAGPGVYRWDEHSQAVVRAAV